MDRTDTGVSYMGTMDRAFGVLEKTKVPDDVRISRHEGQRVAGEEKEMTLPSDLSGNKHRCSGQECGSMVERLPS